MLGAQFVPTIEIVSKYYRAKFYKDQHNDQRSKSIVIIDLSRLFYELSGIVNGG